MMSLALPIEPDRAATATLENGADGGCCCCLDDDDELYVGITAGWKSVVSEATGGCFVMSLDDSGTRGGGGGGGW